MIAAILASAESEGYIIVGGMVLFGTIFTVLWQTRSARLTREQIDEAAATQTEEHGAVRQVVEDAVGLLVQSNSLVAEALRHHEAMLNRQGVLQDKMGVELGKLTLTVTDNTGMITNLTSDIVSLKLRLAENTIMTAENTILTAENADLIVHNAELIIENSPTLIK